MLLITDFRETTDYITKRELHCTCCLFDQHFTWKEKMWGEYNGSKMRFGFRFTVIENHTLKY